MANHIPAPLQPNDKVALISPASPVKSKVMLTTGIGHLHSLGLRVVKGKHVCQHLGYLAGTDKQRLADLKSAVENTAIKGIFFTRGGYGLARLLQHLTPGYLKNYPKLIMGYSDLTLLHLAYQQASIETYWGPMPCTTTGFSTFSKNYFKQLCMGKAQPVAVNLSKCTAVRHGMAKGRLTGGTLTLLASSLGTWYEIDTKNKLVFIEDIDEAPYKIDRLITHLISAGKLVNARGLIFGKFVNCKTNGHQTIREIITDRFGSFKIPVIIGFPVGHIKNQIILPYGRMATLDTQKSSLCF